MDLDERRHHALNEIFIVEHCRRPLGELHIRLRRAEALGESGVMARFLGPVGAAIFGGVGALIVTGLWAKLFPALRKADRLE